MTEIGKFGSEVALEFDMMSADAPGRDRIINDGFGISTSGVMQPDFNVAVIHSPRGVDQLPYVLGELGSLVYKESPYSDLGIIPSSIWITNDAMRAVTPYTRERLAEVYECVGSMPHMVCIPKKPYSVAMPDNTTVVRVGDENDLDKAVHLQAGALGFSYPEIKKTMRSRMLSDPELTFEL